MNFTEFSAKSYQEKSVFHRTQFSWFTNLVKFFAMRFAYLFYRLGISANFLDVITLLGALLGFSLLLKVNTLSVYTSLLGVFLIYFHVFVDFIDGPIAKAKGMTSSLGADFDDIGCQIDRFVMIVLFGMFTGSEYWIIINTFSAAILIIFLGMTFKKIPDSNWVLKLKLVYVHRFSLLSVRVMLGVFPMLIWVFGQYNTELLGSLGLVLSIVYFIMALVWLIYCTPNRSVNS